MTHLAEVQVQQKLAHTTRGQRLLNRRTLWRIVIVFGLIVGLVLFLAWLSPLTRGTLIIGLIANQLLIGLLIGFSLIALSLLWPIELVLGTLTLWLLVELIKAFTNRAHPFNLRRESRVIGRRRARSIVSERSYGADLFDRGVVHQSFSIITGNCDWVV